MPDLRALPNVLRAFFSDYARVVRVAQHHFFGIPRVTTLPTASAFYRETVCCIRGGTGVADVCSVCLKGSDNAYTWARVAITAGAQHHILAHDGTNFVNRADGVFNVMDYGATGDGTTDDTAAFSSAHTALPAAGGTIYVPPGTYKISSVTFTKSVHLLGAGKNASIIRSANATGDVIVLAAVLCEITHLGFNSAVTRTAGSYVQINTAATLSTITDFHMDGHYIGINVQASGGVHIINGAMLYASTTAGGAGILVDVVSGDTYIDTIQMQSNVGSMPSYGIRILQCGACNITNADIVLQGDCLSIEGGAAIYVLNSYFDTATRGIVIAPTGTKDAVRVRFVGCWTSSHTGAGVTIDTSQGTGAIRSIEFIGHHSILNGTDGVEVTLGADVDQLSFIGGLYAANTVAGFDLASGLSGFQITGCKIGSLGGLAGNAYGIYLNGTNDNYRIVGNDCIGNVTQNFVGIVTGTGRQAYGNLPVTGTGAPGDQFGGAVSTVSSILSSSATAGIGYATGAGGVVTQLTNKSTGVTLNTICGRVVMNNDALGSGNRVSFTVTDSAIAVTDVVIVNHQAGGTAGAYGVWCTNVAAGSFELTIRNQTAGSLSEAVVLAFAIIKAVTG